MIYTTTIGRTNILILRGVHASFEMPVLMFPIPSLTMSLSMKNIFRMSRLILLCLLLLHPAIPNLPSLLHIRLARTRILLTVWRNFAPL